MAGSIGLFSSLISAYHKPPQPPNRAIQISFDGLGSQGKSGDWQQANIARLVPDFSPDSSSAGRTSLPAAAIVESSETASSPFQSYRLPHLRRWPVILFPLGPRLLGWLGRHHHLPLPGWPGLPFPRLGGLLPYSSSPDSSLRTFPLPHLSNKPLSKLPYPRPCSPPCQAKQQDSTRFDEVKLIKNFCHIVLKDCISRSTREQVPGPGAREPGRRDRLYWALSLLGRKTATGRGDEHAKEKCHGSSMKGEGKTRRKTM